MVWDISQGEIVVEEYIQKLLFIHDNFGMAMRRLSIIDLKGGKQPISNKDNSINIILNGEIYNYLELRNKLIKLGYTFKTNSDTEVIIHLYEEYGTDSVNYLNGMFAFALWDSNLEKLWIVRDRLGIKPLVYFNYNGSLVFGSTISSITDFKQLST